MRKDTALISKWSFVRQNGGFLPVKLYFFAFVYAWISIASSALAGETPPSFVYQGRLLNSAGTAPLSSVVDLNFKIYNPAGTCLLYEETQTGINLSATSGIFAVQVGSALGSLKRNGSDPGLSMGQIFTNGVNPVRVDDSGTTNTCPGGYTPANGDARLLRVTVIESGVPTVLSPDQIISSQPYATVAQTLQGIGPSGLIQVNGAVNLTQANAELLVSGNDASSLHHHDSVYVKKGDTANQNLGSGDVYTTGRIGVGTSLPATDIEIERTNPTFRMEASSGGAGSSQIQFYSGSTERARIESPESSSELRFYTGGTAALTIDSNQNASFVGNIRTNGFLDLGDYDNAAETALLTYLGTCGVGCTGTIWYSETAGKLRVWDGGGYSTLGDMSTASTDLDMNGHDISNVNNLGVATLTAGSLSATSAVIGGVTISGGLITNLSAPTASGDATNKGYVDAAIAAISTSASGDYVARDGSSALTANWDVGGFDLTNLGNVSLAGQKTVNLGVFTNAQESTATLSMGAGDAGKFWFNSSTNELKYWTGSQVNSLGVSGGSLSSLNGETGSVQTFGTPGTTGLDPNWVSNSNVHTLHIPMASGAGVNAGLISRAEYDTFMNKQPAGDYLLRDGSLSMTGALNLAGNLVNNVATPVASGDAANKGYVDAAIGALSTASGGAYLTIANNLSDLNNAATARTNLGLGSMAEETATDYLLRDGSLSMTGALNLAGNAINNVAAPSSGGDAANKTYVDTAVAAVSTASSGSYLTIANNLSDLNNAATARTNLGLGSMAEETATDYLLRDGSLSMTGALNLAGNDLNNGGTLNATSLASTDAVIGPVTISSGRVQNLSAPTDANDATRKAYVDAAVAAVSTSAGGAYLAISNNLSDLNNAATARTNLGLGSMAEETATDYLLRDGSLSMTGTLNLAGNLVNNVAIPVASGDAANKSYVDATVAALSTSAGTDYVARDGSTTLTGNWNVGGYILSNATLNALAGSAASPGISFDGDTDTGIFSPGANTIAMSTAGTQRLTLDADGNVGVGTSSPTQRLHISGGAADGSLLVDGYSSTVGAAAATIRQSSGNRPVMLVEHTSSSGNGEGLVVNTVGTTGNILDIKDNGTSKLAVADGGNVGIGTGSPTSILDVRGATALALNPNEMSGASRAWMTDGLKIGAGGSDGAYFGMKDEGLNNADTVVAWGDDVGDDLRFIHTRSGGPADGDEYMRITASGNVGIGTVGPSTKFEVAGTIKIADGGEACGSSYVGGIRYTGGSLQFCNGTAWTTLGISGDGLTSLNGETGNTQSFAIGTSGTIPNWSSASDTHTLHIPMASNSGVSAGLLSKADYDTFMGKQDAGDYLLRDGSLSMAGALNLAGNLISNVAAPVASGDAANKSYVDAAVSSVSVYAGDDHSLNAADGSPVDAVYVNNDGNVGIGTTTPTDRLVVKSNDVSVHLARNTTDKEMDAPSTGGATEIFGGDLHIVRSSDETNHWGANVRLYQYSDTNIAGFTMRRARGTRTTPAYLQANDTLGDVNFHGIKVPADASYEGQGHGGARIAAIAEENFSSTAGGSALAFYTTGLGAVTLSQRMRITADGNVGIGTVSPASKLHVNGDLTVNRILDNTPGNALYLKTASATAGPGSVYILDSEDKPIFEAAPIGTRANYSWLRLDGGTDTQMPHIGSFANSTNPGLSLGHNTAQTLNITAAGRVGIGTTAPANALHVSGSIGATGWVGAGCEVNCEASGGYSVMYPTSAAVSTFGWTTTSDRRLKRNIEPLQGSLEKILQIRGVGYNWVREDVNPSREVGVIAQEVQSVFPEVVHKTEDNYLTVDYARLVAPLIEAVREQQNQIDEQSFRCEMSASQMQVLETRINQHDREIASLRKQNQELKRDVKALRTYLCAKDPQAPFCN